MLFGLFFLALVTLIVFLFAKIWTLSLFYGLKEGEYRLEVSLGVGPFALPLEGIVRKIWWKLFQPSEIRDLRVLVSEPIPAPFAEMLRTMFLFFRRVAAFRLHLEYSLGDPFLTALVSGAVWASIGTVFSATQSEFVWEKPPEVDVRPKFGPPQFGVDFSCIFRFGLGHIMFEGISSLVRGILKSLKQRRVQV